MVLVVERIGDKRMKDQLLLIHHRCVDCHLKGLPVGPDPPQPLKCHQLHLVRVLLPTDSMCKREGVERISEIKCLRRKSISPNVLIRYTLREFLILPENLFLNLC